MNELVKRGHSPGHHRAKRLNHNIEAEAGTGTFKDPRGPRKPPQVFMNIIINSLYFTPEGEHHDHNRDGQ